MQVDVALTCCDFQKAQTSELLKILIPRSRFAGPAGHGQVRSSRRPRLALCKQVIGSVSRGAFNGNRNLATASIFDATTLKQAGS